jgi:hypothetical protein
MSKFIFRKILINQVISQHRFYDKNINFFTRYMKMQVFNFISKIKTTQWTQLSAMMIEMHMLHVMINILGCYSAGDFYHIGRPRRMMMTTAHGCRRKSDQIRWAEFSKKDQIGRNPVQCAVRAKPPHTSLCHLILTCLDRQILLFTVTSVFMY